MKSLSFSRKPKPMKSLISFHIKETKWTKVHRSRSYVTPALKLGLKAGVTYDKIKRALAQMR